jgi:hypothetical protein
MSTNLLKSIVQTLVVLAVFAAAASVGATDGAIHISVDGRASASSGAAGATAISVQRLMN